MSDTQESELDVAIARYQRIADSYRNTVPYGDAACRAQQLADWLRELRAVRNRTPSGLERENAELRVRLEAARDKAKGRGMMLDVANTFLVRDRVMLREALAIGARCFRLDDCHHCEVPSTGDVFCDGTAYEAHDPDTGEVGTMCGLIKWAWLCLTRDDRCPECGGDGYYKGPRMGDDPCEACHGTGKRLHVLTCEAVDAWDCMGAPRRSRRRE